MSSCVTSFQVVEVLPKQIKQVSIPEPVSSIFIIEQKHDLIFNQNLSDSMAKETQKAVNQFTPQRIERVVYAPTDSLETREYEVAVLSLLREMQAYPDIRDITLTDSMCKVFSRCGSNLVLCARTEGFVRTPENYKKEYNKALTRAIVGGILSGLVGGAIAGAASNSGRAVYVSFNPTGGGDVTRHGAMTTLFMVDIKRKSIVYKDHFYENSNPLNGQFMQRNIGTMLNKYFSHNSAKRKH